jgi:CspA family cold shock protein
MMWSGRVRDWDDDEGRGVIDCPELDAPCWAHYSTIEMEGFRRLEPGAGVRVMVERFDQDGFRYRATRVVPA